MKDDKVRWERLDENRIIIPKSGDMLVDGIVFANQSIMSDAIDQSALKQVANVACLPGIVSYSLAMPDIHWGYGFPVGGVAAFSIEEGIISPGGVGYDINCGVRMIRSNLRLDQIKDKMDRIIYALYSAIPTGVGSHHREMKLSKADMKRVCENGARWAVEQGFGTKDDLSFLEDGGCLDRADFSEVSEKAYERGKDQIGTLGSGNHFVEVGYCERVFDRKTAEVFGLFEGGITFTIHTGSRGFGHQICTDFIPIMDKAAKMFGIRLQDRQLACAPFHSKEGQSYFSAMACAANFAFANRQIITDFIRKAIINTLGISSSDLDACIVYDVAHNIAKLETHVVEGKSYKLCVHRKGATRALPANHPDLPKVYKEVGQPVLVPGDMGRSSFVLVGQEKAMKETFGSSCHGAGRLLSRTQALKQAKKRDIQGELKKKGIVAMSAQRDTLVEEMPEAYKDVADVVEVMHRAGIATKVALIRPLGVIKG